jgi:hypothetical protein
MADWKPFTPTAQSVRIIAATDPTQNKRLAVFLDQHKNAAAGYPEGRGWWGFVERASNGADMPGLVAELQPICADTMIRGKFYKGWLAPWYPDSKYINEKIGSMDGNYFEIDYNRMETDWNAAEQEYYQYAITAALAHNLPVPQLGGVVDYRLQAIVGKGRKSPRIPRAAKMGHQWLLGFSNEPDEMMARLISASSGHFEIPTVEQVKANESEADTLRRQVAEMQAQMKAFFARAGDDVILPADVKPKKSGKAKRTLSPEHLAAMKAGREKSKQAAGV